MCEFGSISLHMRLWMEILHDYCIPTYSVGMWAALESSARWTGTCCLIALSFLMQWIRHTVEAPTCLSWTFVPGWYCALEAVRSAWEKNYLLFWNMYLEKVWIKKPLSALSCLCLLWTHCGSKTCKYITYRDFLNLN